MWSWPLVQSDGPALDLAPHAFWSEYVTRNLMGTDQAHRRPQAVAGGVHASKAHGEFEAERPSTSSDFLLFLPPATIAVVPDPADDRHRDPGGKEPARR